MVTQTGPALQLSNAQPALVLGGGGMFGAYQAGVWSVLEPHFQPSLFCGASVGSLNAWALAGGASASELCRAWRDPAQAHLLSLRWPRNPVDGCIHRPTFEAFVQQHFARYAPQYRCLVTLTGLRDRRAIAVSTPDISWRHLAASCALPLLLPQQNIAGRWYCDGGLLESTPVWAALEAGAPAAIAINLLPRGGPWALRAARRFVRSLANQTPPSCRSLPNVVFIESDRPLGGPVDSARWSLSFVDSLIERGRRDAETSLPRVFALLETF